MHLHIAGGVGEHGRNCFLLEGSEYNLMVDCGVMAGDENPYPRLTREQIQKTRYVLITHSHQDHTGALPWLIENGFDGTFVMAAETARQLPFSLPNLYALPVSQEAATVQFKDFKVRYGMSGHCAGALSYGIQWEKRKCFFSGDHHFYSYLYEYSMNKCVEADVAVVDSCYPSVEYSYLLFAKYLGKMLKDSTHLLLPVPKYGRGLEILLLLIERYPHVSVQTDSHLTSELARLKALKPWLRKDAYQKLKQWEGGEKRANRHVQLLCDPQLGTVIGRSVAQKYLEKGQPILFSGHLDHGSYAKELLDRRQAQSCIFPVHNSDGEFDLLKRVNHYAITIPAHTPRLHGAMEIDL